MFRVEDLLKKVVEIQERLEKSIGECLSHLSGFFLVFSTTRFSSFAVS